MNATYNPDNDETCRNCGDTIVWDGSEDRFTHWVPGTETDHVECDRA